MKARCNFLVISRKLLQGFTRCGVRCVVYDPPIQELGVKPKPKNEPHEPTNGERTHSREHNGTDTECSADDC